MLGWLLLLGVGCTWAPYLLFSMGVTRMAASRAVVVALVEPVLAAIIGVTFYGERLGPWGVVGVVVVLTVSTRMAAAR
jgi:DME family drug/metabolite transporter